MKRYCLWLIGLMVILLLVLSGCKKENVTIESKLVKAVNIDELSTAQFVYNGIANCDENGKTIYVRYNSYVKLGAETSGINVKVDAEEKKIEITLPDVDIKDVMILPDSIDFIPSNPGLEIKDVMKLCEQDVRDKCSWNDDLYEVAEINLKNAVQALIEPIVKSEGYTCKWKRVRIIKTEEELE